MTKQARTSRPYYFWAGDGEEEGEAVQGCRLNEIYWPAAGGVDFFVSKIVCDPLWAPPRLRRTFSAADRRWSTDGLIPLLRRVASLQSELGRLSTCHAEPAEASGLYSIIIRSAAQSRNLLKNAGPNAQHPENKPVTENGKAGTKPERQNLVSGLFSTLENDPDLRLIVKRWPELSVEMRQAIVKLNYSSRKVRCLNGLWGALNWKLRGGLWDSVGWLK